MNEHLKRGLQQAESEIAAGRPRLYWNTRGGWGELFTELMSNRFGVVVEHVGDMTTANKRAFEEGNNSTVKSFIGSKFGEDAFQRILDEIEAYRQSTYQQYHASKQDNE